MATDATETEDRRLTVEPLCSDGYAILKVSSLAAIMADDDGEDEGGTDMRCQDAMVYDLPSEVLDRFDLILDTTLDGYLGHVFAEQLDDVCEALIALGYSFDTSHARGRGEDGHDD